MATLTTNYSFNKPVVGGDIDSWGTFLNTNFDELDKLFSGTRTMTPNLAAGWKVGGVAVTPTAAELNKLSGVAAGLTAAELSVLDGYTGNTADLNILSGAAAAGLSAAELLYVNGVTSAIQTQLNAKQASNATLTAIAAAGVTTAEIAAATLVTAADTIASNDNDTTIPTNAAVIDYVPVALNASGSAPMYACRAWGNFNGTGTPAFRASGNCSSITDNGTGDYTITMTTAMPDANYVIVVSGNSGNDDAAGSRNDWYTARPLTSSTFRLYVYDQAGTASDSQVIMFSVFR